MSNEKEQFARFNEIVGNLKCENCPLGDKCYDASVTTEDIKHTCEETLWHYVKTGKFLL